MTALARPPSRRCSCARRRARWRCCGPPSPACQTPPCSPWPSPTARPSRFTTPPPPPASACCGRTGVRPATACATDGARPQQGFVQLLACRCITSKGLVATLHCASHEARTKEEGLSTRAANLVFKPSIFAGFGEESVLNWRRLQTTTEKTFFPPFPPHRITTSSAGTQACSVPDRSQLIGQIVGPVVRTAQHPKTLLEAPAVLMAHMRQPKLKPSSVQLQNPKPTRSQPEANVNARCAVDALRGGGMG